MAEQSKKKKHKIIFWILIALGAWFGISFIWGIILMLSPSLIKNQQENASKMMADIENLSKTNIFEGLEMVCFDF